MILGLATAQLAGYRRIDHFPCLAKEVALAEQIGLPRGWFGETTGRDFLELAKDEHVEQVRGVLSEIAHQQVRPDPEGFHRVAADASAVYGWPSRKEGIVPGSAGGKRVGLCFKFSRVLVGDLPADFALHAGNRNPTEFADIALHHARLLRDRHPDTPVLFTLDSGYDSTDAVDRLSDFARVDQRFHFVVAVSNMPHSVAETLVAEAVAKPKREWIKLNKRTSVCELGNRKVFERSRHYPRVVVTRRVIQKYRRSKRGRRYKVSEPHYQLLVTDFTAREASPRTVFARYHTRQEIEASIKDSKQSLAITALPSHHFRANHFFLGIVALAQLLHVLLRRLLWPSIRAWGRTLLRDLYAVPGRVVDRATIVLAAPYRCWRRAYQARRLALKHFGLRIEFATC